ncbi:hypothetical protein [Solibacillus sp. FSL H8-0538]|uniref:hypothetical protein n=1 Tax=Solibacillus sp. FSL H8-0538 TaxID=2921400 RepID=UPI0030F93731
MTLTIGCLHAHSLNIPYIEQAFKDIDVTLSHVVDTELIQLLRTNVANEQLSKQVIQQLHEIECTGVEFILVTCTNYITLLEDQVLNLKVPVLKIDTPFFEQVSQSTKPIKLLFTNQATVKDTMKRFASYNSLDSEQEIEVVVIPETFDLFLAGKSIEHDQRIIEYLVGQDLYGYTVAVAQLSMSGAAKMYSNITGEEVINLLDTLREYLVEKLNLQIVK